MYVVPSGYCAISPNAITPSLRNPPEPLLFLHELPSVRVEGWGGRGGRVLSRLGAAVGRRAPGTRQSGKRDCGVTTAFYAFGAYVVAADGYRFLVSTPGH
jgi:hypothetical protein